MSKYHKRIVKTLGRGRKVLQAHHDMKHVTDQPSIMPMCVIDPPLCCVTVAFGLARLGKQAVIQRSREQ